MSNLLTEDVKGNCQGEDRNINASLRTKSIDIASRCNPITNTMQESKCHNILEPIDKQQSIRCNREISVTIVISSSITRYHKEKMSYLT